ncbi:hypothetical protein QC764_0091070 [Podospora pseudoanserina]|uniref:Uncharacterized protein n=1 Tax=Podospora pseudoanserina TaxID=2609844 RepID=A0ABR0HTG8_9PEZI|nr:hypothetical protein QC764_0091070 [Podospora pseudoanserina]
MGQQPQRPSVYPRLGAFQSLEGVLRFWLKVDLFLLGRPPRDEDSPWSRLSLSWSRLSLISWCKFIMFLSRSLDLDDELAALRHGDGAVENAAADTGGVHFGHL